MKVSFEGIGEIVAGFYNDGAACGEICKISGDGRVSAAAAGDRFLGLVLDCDEAFATVAVCGFVTAAYSGAVPGAGFVKLSADGSGGVKLDSAGAEYAVVCADEGAGTVTIII